MEGEEAREAKPQGLVALLPEVSQQGTGEPQEGCEQGGAESTLGIERLSGAVGGGCMESWGGGWGPGRKGEA